MKKGLLIITILSIIFTFNVNAKNIEQVAIRDNEISAGTKILTETGDVKVVRKVEKTDEEDEFLVTVTSQLKSFGIEATKRPIYMVLVVDFSGSMNSYGETLKQAIKDLSSSMFEKDPNTHIAVVLFDTSAQVALNFTNNINDVNNISFSTLGGSTDINAGFSKAKTLLDNTNVPSDALKVMTLLSDGIDSGYSNTAKTYRSQGITMMSIDYNGTKAEMKQVASCKDGTETCSDADKYYYLSSISDVSTNLLKGLHDLYDRKIVTKAIFTESLGEDFIFNKSITENVTSSGDKVNYQIDNFDENNTYSFQYLIKLKKVKSGNFYTHISHNNASRIDIYDKDNNSLLKTVPFTSSSVIEVKGIKPIIKADDVTIYLGDTISNMTKVTALYNGLNITENVKMIYSDLDINQPGVYEQTFKVIADNEEEALATRKVTVLIKTPDTLSNNIILLGAGIFSLLIGLFIIYKQKRRYN